MRSHHKFLDEDLRYQRVDTCGECQTCGPRGGHLCDVAKGGLRDYGGVRFTADGFDCALPVTIDGHSACSFGCLYCFSKTIRGHVQGTEKEGATIGQCNIGFLERIFAGEGGQRGERVRKVLKYHAKVNGYPCPIQVGGLNDPMDNIERQQGWFLKFCNLVGKYRQPARISTKGNLLLVPEYQKAILEAGSHLFWFAFSLISPDEERLAAIDVGAPSAAARLECMKIANKLGCRTSLRFRPMLPGLSDYTPRHPYAYKELLQRSADAGAYAVSCEVAFLPGVWSECNQERWDRINGICGHDLKKVYGSFGQWFTCTRPAYQWTEAIMHAVRDEGHKVGLVVGVSDPVWKQLGDTGCCCGIRPDDPIWGNWQRESATNRLLEAKNGIRSEIRFEDICPGWAHDVPLVDMVYVGAGPAVACKRSKMVWADKLQKDWNQVSSQRGPIQYFQGALVPSGRDREKNLIFKYVGLQRQHIRSVWRT